MKKIFRLAIVFAISGAALLTGCTKDFGPDITNLENKVKALESTISSLESQIKAGALITNVVKNDDGIKVMAKEIAKRIEEQMEYPGQIRVNVIRETRSTEYAK